MKAIIVGVQLQMELRRAWKLLINNNISITINDYNNLVGIYI